MVGKSLLTASASLLLTACFTVNHELPPHSYFGHLPATSDETSRPFEAEKMKNWLLSGLAPYSDFGVQNLAPSGPEVKRLEDLEIETRFSELDTLVWIVPGAFYGYYVWAPRTVKIKGREVRRQ